MTLRRLWKLLSGATLLASGLLIGDPSPVAASGDGCAGDVVVALDVSVWARPGHDTYEFTLSEPLAPGVWSVQATSSDSYVGRSQTSQAQEQWVLDIAGHTTLGPTTDLADGVEAASVVDNLGTVVSVDGIERFTVRHAGVSTPNGTDSVTANCVSFTLLESPGDGLRATSTVRCGAGEVEIQLVNDGSLDADYVATIGSQVTRGTLVSGAQVAVSADITGAVTVATVSGARGTILDVSLDTTCSTSQPPTTTQPPPTTSQPPTTTQPPPTSTQPPPTTSQPPSTPPPVTPPTPPVPVPALIRASVLVDCAADEVLVLLGNAGEVGATVDVALPLSEVRSGIRVDAGTITTSTLAIGDLDDGITEVRVSDSVTGATYTRETIELACDDPPRPTATTVLDCVGSVIVVHLANQAGDPVQLTVVHERVEILAELELAAGEVAEVEIPLGDATSVPVRVIDASGNDVLRVDVDNVCPRPDTPGVDAGDAAPDDPASAAGAGTVGPSVVRADCAAVAFGSGDRFDVRVELDGAVLVAGTVTGDLRIPVVPGEPIRIIVSDPGSEVPAQVITPGGRPCAEVRVTLAPACASSSAEVSIRRDGVGRERFVILVDGRVAGVLAIDGTGTGTVPVPLGIGDATLTVSRSMATTPIVVGTISCGGGGGGVGAAAPLAASLAVIVMLASAAGVIPWPSKVRLG